MQVHEKSFAENSETKKMAPGIFSIMGAVVLDIALVLLFWFIGMIALTAIWASGALFFSSRHLVSAADPSTTTQMLIALLAMYFAILTLYLWRGRKLQLSAVTIASKKSIWLAVITGTILFFGTVVSTNLLEAAGLLSKPSNQQILEDFSKQWPISIAFFAVVIAPVFEELFFRKQLFGRLVQANHVVIGYAISSVLFALLHEPAPTAGIADWLLKLILYGSMGATFAWVYRKTGKLWPAIVTHGCNNLLGIFALFAMS